MGNKEAAEASMGGDAQPVADRLDMVQGPAGTLNAKLVRAPAHDVQDGLFSVFFVLVLRGKKRASVPARV